MRILFWVFSILWAGVAFCQLMWKGLSTHAGAYELGYWGIHYTEQIVLAEMLLLIAAGSVVHLGKEPHRSFAMIAAVLGCFMMLGLQVVTFEMDTGYVYRKELAGDQFVIPWRYHPSGGGAYHPSEDTGYDTIGIWVVYPGFTPLQDGRSRGRVKVWFQKSPEGSRQPPSGSFKKPRRVDVPECAAAGNWITCRFYQDGFWYNYRHPTESYKDNKVEVPLDEVMETLSWTVPPVSARHGSLYKHPWL